MHLAIKIRISFLKVIANLVRLDVTFIQDAPHGGLACFGQPGKASILGMLAHKFSQPGDGSQLGH